MNENKVIEPDFGRGNRASKLLSKDSPVRPVEEVLADSGGLAQEIQQARQGILDSRGDKTLHRGRAQERLAREKFLVKLASYR